MSETILVSHKETAFEALRDRHRHDSKILFVLLDEFKAPTPSAAHGSLAALSLFREADAQRQYRFFWEQPSKDIAVAASGCMTRVAPDGESVRAFLNLLETDAALDSRMPLLVGGFAFEPEATVRPAAGFVLPEQMLVAHGASIKTMTAQWVLPEDDLDRRLDTALQASNQLRATTLATPAVQPRPGPAEGVRQASSMSRKAFRNAVVRALEVIRGGEVEKVVLSRSVDVEQATPFDISAILGRLRDQHPLASIFAVGEDRQVFLGATPEPLVALEDGCVRLLALAGSAPRSADLKTDTELGQNLRESKKEQAEHAAVVRALRPILEQTCESLEIPEACSLLRLDRIQHLQTPMSGHLREEHCAINVVDLARRIHPTPAVAGSPAQEALQWISKLEPVCRGWYTGGVGYVSASAGGEIGVALRCAQILGKKATLYGGSGIVLGSDPEAEFIETEVKLQAMLSVLGAQS